MINYLKDKSVYLCGPLHSCANSGVVWRDEITPRLLSYGIKVEDPTKRAINGVGEVGTDKAMFQQLIREKKFREAKERFWPLCRADLRSVDKSDFLILNYDASLKTIGSWHETVTASNQKKPILMKYDETQLDSFNVWVLTFIKEGCIFSSWDEMFSYLDEIDRGNFNTSYWTI
jgi:hypothetical protein